jgi:exonuclease III
VPKLALQIETVNTTAWSSAKIHLAKSVAHIVCIQEHKLVSLNDIEEASQWGLANHWKSLWTPAEFTENGGKSGGTAIFVNRAFGLDKPVGYDENLVPARLTGGIVEAPGHRPFLLMSVYLQVGVGLGTFNLNILQKCGQVVAEQGLQCIIAGDFNSGPAAVAASGFPLRAGLQIVAPRKVPTCVTSRSASIIDFYLISTQLAQACCEVEVNTETETAPHRPVILNFVPVPIRQTVTKLRMPKRLPRDVPFGPRPQPLCWEPQLAAATLALFKAGGGSDHTAQAALDTSYRIFAEQAEKEILNQTSASPASWPTRGREPRLVQVPMLPTAANRNTWVSISRPSKWLLQRTRELRALIIKLAGDPQDELGMERLEELQQALLFEAPTAVNDMEFLRQHSAEMAELAKATVQDCLQGILGEVGHKAVELIDLTIESLNTFVETEARSDKMEAHKAWTSWADEATLAGAGRAHRWSRVPQAWRPQSVIREGIRSALPVNVLQSEADRMAEVWESDQVTLPIVRGEALPRLTPTELRSAAHTFATTTAQTYDGFHLKHFTLLSDEALLVIAIILENVERLGAMPRATALVHMVLLEKSTGGHRGIGLFPSLYRLWARARRPWARRWEAAHKRTYLACCSGASCVDAVWRQALANESANLKGEAVGCFLWDLKQFYEHLDRAKLRNRARALDFPDTIVRVSCYMYGARRVVAMQDIAVDAGRPKRGIAAGCGFATYYAQIYVIPGLDWFSKANPKIGLQIYVDDFTGQTKDAEEHTVAERLVDGARKLLDLIEVDLECTLSVPKACLIASSDRLLGKLGKAFGQLKGSQSRTVANLGIDFAAGRHRGAFAGNSIRRKRLRQATRRLPRVRRLRAGAGDRVHRLFTSGLGPAAWYGAEVYGFSDKELWQLQTTALATLTPQASGRSRHLTLLLADDQSWRPTAAPIVRWAKEVWLSVVKGPPAEGTYYSLAELGCIWRATELKAPTKWAQVRGPVAAMALSMRRIGWKATGPYTFIDDLGVDRTFTETSPKMMQVQVAAAHTRLLERQAAERLGWQPPGRANTDHIRAFLKGDHTALQRGSCKALVCNAVWTNSRAHQAGYDTEPFCVDCPGRTDNISHRLWHCTRSEQLRVAFFEDSSLPDRMKELAEEDPLHRGLVLQPGTSQPGPLEDAGVVFWSRTGLQRTEVFHGEVFLDGSCTKTFAKELNRASWAITKIDEITGELEARLHGPVWATLPQTSPAAEFCAMAALAQVAGPCTTAHSDFSGVVSSFAKHPEEVLHQSSVFAGIHRSARIEERWHNIVDIQKVKAHQDLGNLAKGSREYFLAKGNDEADRWAKAALACHPQLDEHLRRQQEEQVDEAKEILAFASQALALWPKAARPQLLPKALRPAQDGRPCRPGLMPRTSHSWQFLRGFWRCSACLTFATSRCTRDRRAKEKCEGRAASFVKLFENNEVLGHLLSVFDANDSFVVACLACGAWASSRPVKLLEVCCGVPKLAGITATRRLALGQHPVTIGAVVGPGKQITG